MTQPYRMAGATAIDNFAYLSPRLRSSPFSKTTAPDDWSADILVRSRSSANPQAGYTAPWRSGLADGPPECNKSG